MRVFLQVSAHDFNEFRICLPLRPDRTSRRPDANDLIGPGMANAVSGSGSGGEERPPARIGFKLLDDGSALGRAWCRKGVCQYVQILVGAGSLKKKKQQT